jgi:hypothetical protein
MPLAKSQNITHFMSIDLEKLCDITNSLASYLHFNECRAQILLVDIGNYLKMKVMLAVKGIDERAGRKERKKRRIIDKENKKKCLISNYKNQKHFKRI